MTKAADTNHSPDARIAQVTGVSARLEEPLERSLLVKLKVAKTSSSSVLLERKGKAIEFYKLQSPLILNQGSTLTVRVLEKRRILPNKTIARTSFPFETLWPGEAVLDTDSCPGGHQIHLRDSKKQIWLTLDLSPSAPRSLPSGEGQSSRAEENTPHAQERAEDPLEVSIHGIEEKLAEFRTVLDKMSQEKHNLNTGLKFGAALSGLEPTAKGILDRIIVAYEQMATPGKGYEDILGLAKSMATTVTHIQSVEKITQLSQVKKTLNGFPGLMQETANLIESLARPGILEYLASSATTENEIGKLQKRHALFREEFDRSIRIDTAVVEPHFLIRPEDVEELEEYLLQGIRMVDPRAVECMEGTRDTILENVTTMVDDLNGPNVIWIRGAPGSGKSSISLTIKSLLQQSGRLVLYFRFDRTEATVATSNALWRYIAYELAKRFPPVMKHNLSLIRSKSIDLASTTDVFTSLVQEPFSKSTDPPPDHPCVIVVDALDECGGIEGRSSSDRKSLLQILRRWPKLPRHLKLLVTSREEGDIRGVLSHISTAIEIPSGVFLTENPSSQASIEVTNNIRTFLEKRFQDIREHFLSLPRDWPGVDIITEMVGRAAGNFMWVTAATDFIDSDHPEEQLNKIISQIPNESVQPLYFLYTTILDASFGNLAHTGSGIEALRAILGTVIFSRRPLSDDEYTKLPITKPIGKAQIESTRDRLRAVADRGPILRFVHKSFDDFLLSEACPPKYRIQPDKSQLLLTKLCLTTMDADLCFNICNLETSFLRNTDVPDIEAKIKKGISRLLSYSCNYWADHLSRTTFNDELMLTVKEMIFDKLLYWFEALSLLSEINRASHALAFALNWSKVASNEELEDFLRDGLRFIGAFGQPIAQSAAHIYISALPFAPKNSLVARRFLSQYPHTIMLFAGQPTNWSSCIFTSDHHTDWVRSIAFSPDGKSFASGSDDETIYILDSETGNLLSGPFIVDRRILGIFFDRDGRRVWANCRNGKLIGWDVETGDEHLTFGTDAHAGILACCCFDGGPNIVSVSRKEGSVTLWSGDTGERLQDLFKIPADESTHLVCFSPGGRYLAWAGGGEKVIKIRKLVDGSESDGGFGSQGHTEPITTISFSLEGDHVVSGSQEGTIVVWDVNTGNILDRPLDTGRERVTAVAYSHKRKLLVSAASDPGVVMVWDSSTHEVIFGPLSGHSLEITAIVLPRDGRRALSASYDGTVRMWDLNAKGVAYADNATLATEGHNWPVTCITFSPCGEKLASLASGGDDVIDVWDVRTGARHSGPFKLTSHSSDVKFSPDGGLLAAYDNATLKIWNINNGELNFHQNLSDGGGDIWHYLAFRLIDSHLVTCSFEGDVRLWSLEDNFMTEDFSIRSPESEVDDGFPVEVISLSPDGSKAVVRDRQNRTPPCYLWSTITGKSIDLAFPDDEYISEEAFSPSGRFLVTIHAEILRVWNTQTGEIVAISRLADGIQYPIFSPDDRHIVFVYYHSTTIWILNPHTSILTSIPWQGHIEGISGLTFSADGRKLASCSKGGQIRIWDTAELAGDSQAVIEPLALRTHMQEGWIINEDGEMLLWVPKDHRERLSWDPNAVLIGGSGIRTQLDLKNFRHGKGWAECYGGKGRVGKMNYK